MSIVIGGWNGSSKGRGGNLDRRVRIVSGGGGGNKTGRAEQGGG